MIIAFWSSLLLIVYTFLGYAIVLFCLIRIKRLFKKPITFSYPTELPSVTILIAAYNEEDIIEDKIQNTLALDYPKERLEVIIITDGSTDDTPVRVSKYGSVKLMHSSLRAGKMAAIKRAISSVTGEILVFTDANTFLNRKSIKELVKHYQNPNVGAVAGEKRIAVGETADASSAGEGFYWKYESLLKKWDYELYSNVGAAGELFSIRSLLFEPVEADTIIDDHMIAMRIAEKGYIIAYEPLAYAMESASADSNEELKRKIRIAAGGIQSIFRLNRAANPFKYPVLTFQYVSHRVLRWTVTPFAMILVFILNAMIIQVNPSVTYIFLFTAQVLFYMLSIAGWYFERRNVRLKALFIPFYFCMMNYAVLAGIIRYFRKQQSAAWEKSKRKSS